MVLVRRGRFQPQRADGLPRGTGISVRPAPVKPSLTAMTVRLAAVVWGWAASSTSAEAQERMDLRVELNIPAFRLDLYENSTRVRQYVVAVGAPQFPTPAGDFAITRIEWNPWWNPPPVDWAKADTVTPPGLQNPMGRVKLAFYDDYFIHGTSEATSLGRATSHGCVRMQNEDAIDLATVIHQYASPDLTPADIKRLRELDPASQTETIALRHPVPMTVRYEIVELHDDQLIIYADLYSGVRESIETYVLRILSRNAYDTTQIDLDRLAYWVGLGSSPNVIPVAELLSNFDRPRAGGMPSTTISRSSYTPRETGTGARRFPPIDHENAVAGCGRD